MMRVFLACLGVVITMPLIADEAVIDHVEAAKTGGAWRFDVTITHADTGWDHYADGWRIISADGDVYGYRELLHPHVNEQPFTRSLSGVVIPDDMTMVYIEASDNVHGAGPRVAFALPK